ncbi:MAG: hypothetical protein IB616_00700 [Methanosarcinales archaeon]|nr:MAG: hypothetical protein IB616_00700 [Methanosarcinales archaeon]
MEITALDVLKFMISFIFLLIVPGFNLLRTANRLDELEIEEKIVVSFGISVIVLTFISLLLSLQNSIGLNFRTLVTFMTLFIILSTKEVIDCTRKLLGHLRH